MTTLPQTIGDYPIERELGRGGMGVVYLARDPRLDRLVAIKVLPEAFAQDPERLARFQREARLLAALNHQHIAAIYGLEEVDGHHLLILEYVPGITLSSRIQAGAVPIDEAVKIGQQIAEGLEAAHERDVVHRDLKPDNVRITPDGVVKILDFGLATTTAPMGGDMSLHEATTRITRTTAITAVSRVGMVMGTPGYMSPEQARGVGVDKRADIWAFGCILYECLTGSLLFGGSTVSDFIAAVLEREPDWALLPPKTPTKVRDLLKRCTVKNARRRLRDVGDARIELEELLATPMSSWNKPTVEVATHTPGGGKAQVVRLNMPLPPEHSLINGRRCAVTMSASGSHAAYVGSADGRNVICVRAMDQSEAHAVPGTAGGESPFFSPDAQYIGFFAGGKLKKVPIGNLSGIFGGGSGSGSGGGGFVGGGPVTLCDAPNNAGGVWDSSSIYFIPDIQRGLVKIAPTGGATSTIARPDPLAGQRAMLYPHLMPGAMGGNAKQVLVTLVAGPTFDDAQIAAVNLVSGKVSTVLHGGACGRVIGEGTSMLLVYAGGGRLYAAPLDPETLTIHGNPAPVLERVLTNAMGAAAQYALGGGGSGGGSGTLVYAPGEVFAPTTTLMHVPRGGATEPAALLRDRKAFLSPAFSPDGSMLAVQVQGVTDSIWVYDLSRQTPTPVVVEGDNTSPVWTPDGRRIAFRQNLDGKESICWASPDGSQGVEKLFESDLAPTPCSFSPDGKTLAFTQVHPHTGADIWALNVETKQTRPLVQSPFNSWGARFSPSGPFVAYVSDQTGRPEVYAQATTGPGQRWPISTDGGTAPVWAPGGGELFFRAGKYVTAVRIAVHPSFMVGRPRPVFEGVYIEPSAASPNYDVHPTSGDFVTIRPESAQEAVTTLQVVLNWPEELRKRSVMLSGLNLTGQ